MFVSYDRKIDINSIVIGCILRLPRKRGLYYARATYEKLFCA
jgi:hypothetical protein